MLIAIFGESCTGKSNPADNDCNQYLNRGQKKYLIARSDDLRRIICVFILSTLGCILSFCDLYNNFLYQKEGSQEGRSLLIPGELRRNGRFRKCG